MGFLDTTEDVTVYITKRARDYIVSGQIDRVAFDRIAIGDSDIDYRNTDDLPAADFLPDLTGEFNGSINNITSNTDIKHKLFLEGTGSAQFGQIQSNQNTQRGFFSFRQRSGLETQSVDRYFFTYADRTDLASSKTHLFSSFNLPITQESQDEFDAKYTNTALQYINSDTAIFMDITKAIYDEQIDGKSFRLNIPMSGTLTEATLYGRYFANANIEEPYSTLVSDPNGFSQEFGSAFTDFDPRNSNVAYLFSDEIASPISGDTWETTDRAIFSDSKEVPNCDTVEPGKYVDKAVGIAYLDKGFAVITHPRLVDEFVYANGKLEGGADYVGGQDFTRIYLEDSELEYRTFKNVYLQNLNYIIQQSEFNRSSNPTYDPDVNNDLYITEVGAYNSDNELMVMAKFREPQLKEPDVTNIPISIKVFL